MKTFSHGAIDTHNKLIDFNKRYLYQEFNYPNSWALLFSAIVNVIEGNEDDWGVHLKVKIVQIHKKNSFEIKNGDSISISQQKNVAEMWILSEFP